MTLALWTGARRPPRRWQAEAVPLAIAHPGAPLIDACTGAGKTDTITEIVWWDLQDLADDEVVLVMTSRKSLVVDLSGAAVKRCGRASVGRWYSGSKRWARVVYSCYNSLEAVADQVEARGQRVRRLICDEAHRLTTPEQWKQVHRLDPRSRVALTATAYTSSGGVLEGWEVIYSYRVIDALRDGVLVRPNPVHWDGEDLEDANWACIDMIQRRAPPGPGIVSAHDIEDAEWYAEELTAAGIPAMAMHSKLGKKEQRRRIGLLEAGELRALVHPKIMTEGVDIPSIRWVCLRVRRSLRDLAQEVGRGIRSLGAPDAWGDKTGCVVLDVHTQVPTPDAIDNDPNAEAAELLELMTREEREKAERKAAAEREKEERAIARVRRVGELSTWCAQVRYELVIHGWLPRRQDGAWQTAQATQAQLDALTKASKKTRWLPGHVRDGVRFLLSSPDQLTRGAVADILDVLSAASRQAYLHSLSGGDPALGVAALVKTKAPTRDELRRALESYPAVKARDVFDAWIDRGWASAEDYGTGRAVLSQACLDAVQAQAAQPPRVKWSWRWPESVTVPEVPT